MDCGDCTRIGKNKSYPEKRFGVLDHYVSLTSLGVEVYVPMRVVQNGINGSEVIFTLFLYKHISQKKILLKM